MSKPRAAVLTSSHDAGLPRGITFGATLFATVLTAAAAQVSVTAPGSLIPFTLQPAAVLLAGVVLGGRLGAASQLLYLVLGTLGRPMFAWSVVLLPGAARFAGPTGGFLLAFPLAALVAGAIYQRSAGGAVRAASAMVAGVAVLYAVGAPWAVALTPGPAWPVLAALVPYIVADVAKVLLIAPAVPVLRRALGRA